LRVLKIYERNNMKNAIDVVDYVLSRLPFRVQVIQTDRAPYGWSSEFNTQFHWHLQDQGIQHVYIPRLHPTSTSHVYIPRLHPAAHAPT
jgi:hypothetical protein